MESGADNRVAGIRRTTVSWRDGAGNGSLKIRQCGYQVVRSRPGREDIQRHLSSTTPIPSAVTPSTLLVTLRALGGTRCGYWRRGGRVPAARKSRLQKAVISLASALGRINNGCPSLLGTRIKRRALRTLLVRQDLRWKRPYKDCLHVQTKSSRPRAGRGDIA